MSKSRIIAIAFSAGAVAVGIVGLVVAPNPASAVGADPFGKLERVSAVGAITIAGTPPVKPVAPPATAAPFGHFDRATYSPGKLTSIGRSVDPDTAAPTLADLSPDGNRADLSPDGNRYASVAGNAMRPDVAAAYRASGGRHGYSANVVAHLWPRIHRDCVLALNNSVGAKSAVSCFVVNVPPPPDPTEPPSTTSGEAVNGTNTGLAAAGVSASSLVTTAGTTYGSAFNGQTISGKLYTGRVNISGNNITLKNCKVLTGGLSVYGIEITGDNDTVQNCDVTAPAGKSLYEPIFLSPGSDGATITRNNISRGENLLTTYGTHAQITQNYLHDVALDSNPSDHPDGIEIYGGGPVLIAGNRIQENNPYDSPINAAPWGSYTLTDLTVTDNFIDGGQSMTLIDNQNSNGYLRNTRIERNVMGGHTNPDTNMSFGIYKALNNADRRPIVQTETQLATNPNAILWPTTGADPNHWGECTNLSPDRTGQIALPN